MTYSPQNHQTFLIILVNAIIFVILLFVFYLPYVHFNYNVNLQQALYEHFLTPLHQNLIPVFFN